MERIYNKEYTILALREIREMVLHHLDAEARKEAVLVSRVFYETICFLERKKCLVIDEDVSLPYVSR